jgi:hypothetical protein
MQRLARPAIHDVEFFIHGDFSLEHFRLRLQAVAGISLPFHWKRPRPPVARSAAMHTRPTSGNKNLQTEEKNSKFYATRCVQYSAFRIIEPIRGVIRRAQNR